MKIRMDFVSNSSSTSFIYVSENELTEDRFYEAIGVSPDSPLIELFSDFYSTLSNAISRGKDVGSIEDLGIDDKYPEYPEETIAIIKEMLSQGKRVKLCSLDSDGELPEAFLCTESFEINSDDMIISAYNNYW